MDRENSPYAATFRRALRAGTRIPDTTVRTRPAPQAQRNREPGTPPLVLVADDVPEMRSLLVTALSRAGYRVQECRDGWDLLKGLKSYILPMPREEKVDLVISDIRMPGLTGLEVLEGAKCAEDFPPVILITAFGDEETHRQAVEGGVAVLLDKPFDLDDLVLIAQQIVPVP